MPRKGSSRSRGRSKNFVVLKVNAALQLATLANGIVVDADLLDLADDVNLISADLQASILGLTAGEGPIEVGVNSDALTVTQVLEAITASPTSRGDRIALERTSRPVRSLGTFSGVGTEEVLNNGLPIRIKLKFALSQNQVLRLFALNLSGATLTTGAVVRLSGKIYATWS